MLRIGQMSKDNKVSTKTLRHYDKIGLLRPELTDERTGYRLYSEQQIHTLNCIQILKKAGFSLKSIKSIINSGFIVEELIKVLKNRRTEIKKEIDNKMKQMEYIHSQVLELIDGNGPLMNEDIKESWNDIKIYPVSRHYDLLATIQPDPLILQRYMAQWDGEQFFNELKPFEGKKFLEVGIGVGRIAKAVLQGGGHVTGIDLSMKSLECASIILSSYIDNLELIHDNIIDLKLESKFDAAYSVLAFCHIRDKQKALMNMVQCVKPEGKIVLSIELPSKDYESACFVDGNIRYRTEYWPNNPDDIASILGKLNCKVICRKDLQRIMVDEVNTNLGEPVAQLIIAVKL